MLHPYQQQVDKSGGNFSTEGETSTLVSLHLSTRLILSNEGKRAVEQGNWSVASRLYYPLFPLHIFLSGCTNVSYLDYHLENFH